MKNYRKSYDKITSKSLKGFPLNFAEKPNSGNEFDVNCNYFYYFPAKLFPV